MTTPRPTGILHRTNYLQELGNLFRDVQLQGVFSDSKTFNDCVPKFSYTEILSRYETEKLSPTFDLTVFVFEHFELPDFKPEKYETDPSRPIEEHIGLLWEILTREHYAESGSSLIPLPNPYVVPGGRFRGMYYWDSYFTMLGLQLSGHIGLIESMLENFSYYIRHLGFIPNANRTYYLGRSQPPVLVLMIGLLADEKGDAVWKQYLPVLEKEYLFWMKGAEALSPDNPSGARVVRMPDGSVLNRYWDQFDDPRPESFREDVDIAVASRRDPAEVYRHIRAGAESGWDFSSRWLRDHHTMESICTTDIIPVDLNYLLLHIEKVLLSRYEKSGGKHELAAVLPRRITERENALRTYCWDEVAGFYCDYNWVLGTPTGVFSLAALFPLFFKEATDIQAKHVAGLLESRFLKPGGFVTSLHYSKQQWDDPNGWAPLQWITFVGLRNYGFDALAEKGRIRWLDTNRKVYELTGKLTEKYNVTNELAEAKGGEYPNQDGFGWTNAIYLKFAAFGAGSVENFT